MLTSSERRSCRFFRKIETTSTPVQAPSAPSNVSFGLGPFLCSLAASNSTVCPEGIVARNSSSPAHFTTAVRIVVSGAHKIAHKRLYREGFLASSVGQEERAFYASAESLGRSEALTA